MTADTSSQDKISEIISTLKELNEDATVPRNVRVKIEEIISSLEKEGELLIKINKALDNLDDIADDPNLQAFTRTQIWNIVSLLEKVWQSVKDHN